MARTRGAARPFLLPVLSLRRLKELAHKHGLDAIEELARLARKAESEAARGAGHKIVAVFKETASGADNGRPERAKVRRTLVSRSLSLP